MREFLNDELVPAAIALLLVGAFTYLQVTGQGPTAELKDLVLIILGFYFGSKGVQVGQRSAAAARSARRSTDAVPSNSAGAPDATGTPPAP